MSSLRSRGSADLERQTQDSVELVGTECLDCAGTKLTAFHPAHRVGVLMDRLVTV